MIHNLYEYIKCNIYMMNTVASVLRSLLLEVSNRLIGKIGYFVVSKVLGIAGDS